MCYFEDLKMYYTCYFVFLDVEMIFEITFSMSII